MLNCLDFGKLLYSTLSIEIKTWNQEIANTSYYEVLFFKNIGIVYDDEKGNKANRIKKTDVYDNFNQ